MCRQVTPVPGCCSECFCQQEKIGRSGAGNRSHCIHQRFVIQPDHFSSSGEDFFSLLVVQLRTECTRDDAGDAMANERWRVGHGTDHCLLLSQRFADTFHGDASSD